MGRFANSIDQYATTLIRVKARQLVGRYGFTRSDQEDIEQSLTLDLHARLPQFNPHKGRTATFARMVVENGVASLIRERNSQSGRFRRAAMPFDEIGDDDVCTDPVDSSFTPLQRDRAIDVMDAVEELDTSSRRMCQLLMHYSIAETARRLGLTRNQARTRVAQIKTLLTDKGIGEYTNSQ